jgi:hypothetical protein
MINAVTDDAESLEHRCTATGNVKLFITMLGRGNRARTSRMRSNRLPPMKYITRGREGSGGNNHPVAID